MSSGAKRLLAATTREPQISRARLAENLGVSKQAVSAWGRGISRPSVEHLVKIEELLGIPVAEWVHEESGE